jgi:pre-mRNA-processing factor 40
MLGQAGSTPLELFWDVVDSLEIEFRLKRDYVLDVLEVSLSQVLLRQEKRYEVSESTNYEEFKSLMSTDPRTSVIPEPLLQRIFANLVKKSQRHSSDRPLRKRSNDFRSLLRHMPEVTYESTWEVIKPLVADSEEYKALESEEERITVFDKAIRRLKEKREEEKRYREREGSARESSKRDREESRHRDRDRERSRRRYEDDYDRSHVASRARSREKNDHFKDRDRDRKYRDRSRSYPKMEEIEYSEEPRKDQDRRSKRRSEDDLRQNGKVGPQQPG